MNCKRKTSLLFGAGHDITAQDILQLLPVQQKEVLDLLDKFSDIFTKDSTDYGLVKSVIHQIYW
ncbi:hypothetical protein DSO57_1037072 [Entomophthora muscae]|uniref:Uncharacterized protein n=1 Tax=Entomophthora muscae TaxID=34485 RepID=A0ACC2RDW4_9FUNG|nr:hypothetical protein DSO57_1037072 [Entomophthora muscae]